MKATRNCSVDLCDQAARYRGMCGRHYKAWMRAGGLGATCSVPVCDRFAIAKGLCNTHYERQRTKGDAGETAVNRRGSLMGPDHPLWKGDEAGYMPVHRRLVVRFGKATEHMCEDCGGPADQWSYDGKDPDERKDRYGTYSTKFEHYAPRCHSCHGRFDGKLPPWVRAWQNWEA